MGKAWKVQILNFWFGSEISLSPKLCYYQAHRSVHFVITVGIITVCGVQWKKTTGLTSKWKMGLNRHQPPLWLCDPIVWLEIYASHDFALLFCFFPSRLIHLFVFTGFMCQICLLNIKKKSAMWSCILETTIYCMYAMYSTKPFKNK